MAIEKYITIENPSMEDMIAAVSSHGYATAIMHYRQAVKDKAGECAILAPLLDIVDEAGENEADRNDLWETVIEEVIAYAPLYLVADICSVWIALHDELGDRYSLMIRAIDESTPHDANVEKSSTFISLAASLFCVTHKEDRKVLWGEFEKAIKRKQKATQPRKEKHIARKYPDIKKSVFLFMQYLFDFITDRLHYKVGDTFLPGEDPSPNVLVAEFTDFMKFKTISFPDVSEEVYKKYHAR